LLARSFPLRAVSATLALRLVRSFSFTVRVLPGLRVPILTRRLDALAPRAALARSVTLRATACPTFATFTRTGSQRLRASGRTPSTDSASFAVFGTGTGCGVGSGVGTGGGGGGGGGDGTTWTSGTPVMRLYSVSASPTAVVRAHRQSKSRLASAAFVTLSVTALPLTVRGSAGCADPPSTPHAVYGSALPVRATRIRLPTHSPSPLRLPT
jgi:hypothetical protein